MPRDLALDFDLSVVLEGEHEPAIGSDGHVVYECPPEHRGELVGCGELVAFFEVVVEADFAGSQLIELPGQFVVLFECLLAVGFRPQALLSVFFSVDFCARVAMSEVEEISLSLIEGFECISGFCFEPAGIQLGRYDFVYLPVDFAFIDYFA